MKIWEGCLLAVATALLIWQVAGVTEESKVHWCRDQQQRAVTAQDSMQMRTSARCHGRLP